MLHTHGKKEFVTSFSLLDQFWENLWKYSLKLILLFWEATKIGMLNSAYYTNMAKNFMSSKKEKPVAEIVKIGTKFSLLNYNNILF